MPIRELLKKPGFFSDPIALAFCPETESTLVKRRRGGSS